MARELLSEVSAKVHKPLVEIIPNLPEHVVKAVATYPGFLDLLAGAPAGGEIIECLQAG